MKSNGAKKYLDFSKKLGQNPPYFKNTRIPVAFLFDYLKAGSTVNDFLRSYPWLKKRDIIGLISTYEKLSF